MLYCTRFTCNVSSFNIICKGIDKQETRCFNEHLVSIVFCNRFISLNRKDYFFSSNSQKIFFDPDLRIKSALFTSRNPDFSALPRCCILKCTDWSLGKIRQLLTQHKSAQGHQQTLRIIITTAVTACNNRLIVETIITSHTGIACHVEYQAALPRFQSIDLCWVCVGRTLFLNVLYSV